jgi:iron complex outermembrane receptor protein
MSQAWALSVSYGNSHLVRDRHFNSINLDTYGPDTTGNGLLTIGQQPGATFDNSNYRAEIAGAFNLWFMRHQLLLGSSRNIRDAFNSTNIPATCPGATPTASRVACAQNVFDPVEVPKTPFPARTGTRARIDDIGYYLFDRVEMADWLHVLAGVRKSDYTESSLDTGAVTFQDKPASMSYGVVVKPRRWMSVYGTYIEGLESTPAAPILAANFGAQLPATDSKQREAGIKIEPHAGLLVQAAYFNIERGSAFINGANLYVLDGRAQFRGVEFNITGEVTSDWSLYATGQFLDAKQISGEETRVVADPVTGGVIVVPTVVGRRIENSPERTFSLASEYRLSGLIPGFSVNGAAYYLSERAVNQFNQAYIPGYTLFDLGAAYTGTLAGYEATMRVTGQNISNKKYFSSTGGNIVAQGPPRMMKFSVTMRF